MVQNNNSVPNFSASGNINFNINGKYQFASFRTSDQLATFLKYLTLESIFEELDTPTTFELFYNCCYDFLNTLYSEKYVLSTDPSSLKHQLKIVYKYTNSIGVIERQWQSQDWKKPGGGARSGSIRRG